MSSGYAPPLRHMRAARRKGRFSPWNGMHAQSTAARAMPPINSPRVLRKLRAYLSWRGRPPPTRRTTRVTAGRARGEADDQPTRRWANSPAQPRARPASQNAAGPAKGAGGPHRQTQQSYRHRNASARAKVAKRGASRTRNAAQAKGAMLKRKPVRCHLTSTGCSYPKACVHAAVSWRPTAAGSSSRASASTTPSCCRLCTTCPAARAC